MAKKKGGKHHEWKRPGRGHKQMYKRHCWVMRQSGMINQPNGTWVDATGDQASFKNRGLDLW
jgi:hypothetical protein